MVDQRRIDDQRFVEAEAAARYLGIRVRSLYAYVSRGQVRSVPNARGRARLYSLDDLERLRVRRDARAGHGAVAAGALRWGEPVLDSAITAITARGPAYRGKLAIELAARRARFENVAELLWTGMLPDAPVTWPRQPLAVGALARVANELAPLHAMAVVLALASGKARDEARADAIIDHGRRSIPLLAAALAPDLEPAAVTRALGAGSIATTAARALGLDDDAASPIEHALVLLADHELNASSFAARIAASTGADPYACLVAALATLSGPRHGGAPAEVARFADEVGAPGDARAAIRALRKAGELPPGFGHPLYPGGDPRAASLLGVVEQLPRRSRRLRTLLAIVDATTDARPTIDVALAALVAALGAPVAAASGLFAVARAAGWIAHVLEQRAAGHLLRPRARYVGAPVEA